MKIVGLAFVLLLVSACSDEQAKSASSGSRQYSDATDQWSGTVFADISDLSVFEVSEFHSTSEACRESVQTMISGQSGNGGWECCQIEDNWMNCSTSVGRTMLKLTGHQCEGRYDECITRGYALESILKSR